VDPSKIHRVDESHFFPDHSRPESSGNHLLRVLVWIPLSRHPPSLNYFLSPGNLTKHLNTDGTLAGESRAGK